MKRITIIITTAVFSVLLTVMTAYADEAAADGTSDQQTQLKNECLLKAKNCGHSAISIQDKIEMLKEEIAKGKAVYTPEELNNLQLKLDEVNKVLDLLLDK